MSEFRRKWTQPEICLAAKIYRETPGITLKVKGARAAAIRNIAHAANRSYGTVEARLTSHGPTFDDYKTRNRIPLDPTKATRGPSPTTGSFRATEDALAERDRRKEAYDARDLTGAFCGDPPVGFSALDMRRR